MCFHLIRPFPVQRCNGSCIFDNDSHALLNDAKPDVGALTFTRAERDVKLTERAARGNFPLFGFDAKAISESTRKLSSVKRACQLQDGR
jgi:hypothetical protein